MTQIHAPTTAKLTTAELAAYLRVTSRTLQSWRDAGKIPFVRISARCLRYNLSEVEAALQQKKTSF